MKPYFSLMVCVYLTAAAPSFAQSSYIFQLPGPNGLTTQIVGFGDNDFRRVVGPTAGPAGATKVLATPSGSKFYILAPGGIYSAPLQSNGTLGALTRVSAISGAVTTAEVSPDGKYLLVIADQFYVLSTASDTLAVPSNTGVPAGSIPVGVVASHDAKTAWVVANTTAGSTITPLDLAGFQPAGVPLSLPFSAASMVLSARGLLYVTTSGDRLYEIDPIALSITTSGQIPVQGTAGPLQFTPDGTSAYFLFSHPCQSCPSIGKLNVPSHSVTGWPSDGRTPPAIDQILVAGNNRIFALSAGTTQLFDVTPTPLALTLSSLGNVPTSNVVAAAVSNERSSARYLYVLITDHNFYRINLTTIGIDGGSSLDPANGAILSFVPIPAKSGASSVFQINPTQTVTPSKSTVLIGQVLDPVGRPVLGANATFSSDCAGLIIASPSVVSTSEGWAQTTITAPAVVGTCTVTLAVGALSASFQVNVGNSTTGGGGSKISIYAGDGELLRANETMLETQVPMTVMVTDSDGNAQAGVSVTFQVTEGIGSVLFPQEVKSDAAGLAKANFSSAPLPSGAPFTLSKVAASSSFGTAEFYEVSREAEPLNNPHPPIVDTFVPDNAKLTIPQGGILVGGISNRILSNHGTPTPIPNVGIRLADQNDITAPSKYVGCVGLSRSDNSGISRCDVQAFCQPAGTIPPTGLVIRAIIQTGEYHSRNLEVTITNGLASQLTPIFGNNQTGNPSDTLTLIARVTDGCGVVVPNLSGLSWSIQGAASFNQQQTSTDSTGNVSARVTLGATPGPVRVLLAGPNLPTIAFSLTTQVIVSGISVVSGGGQSVVVGKAFPNPVVFVIRDDHNLPVPGLLVSLTATGGATVNPTSATSNAQGQVQTNVTSGSVAGTIVVTAKYNNLTGIATLSANPPGPDVTSTSFKNAASGAVGLTPCGLATAIGNGIAPTVSGVVSGQNFFGLLQYTVAGLSMTVNNIPAPIHSVANVNGVQQVNFQAPCELTPGTATIVVTVNSVSTTVSGVPVFAVQPGIFTFAGPNNKQYGTVIRVKDGSLVTANNPARQGEQYYMVVTGLGLVTPAAATNTVGTGSQDVNLSLAVGIHDLGVPVVSARYLAGYIGAYRVDFLIPLDAPLGPDQNLALAAYVDGNNLLFGNTVFLPSVISQ